MFSWNTIAKFIFLWILGALYKQHREFMRKKKARWPFRKRESA